MHIKWKPINWGLSQYQGFIYSLYILSTHRNQITSLFWKQWSCTSQKHIKTFFDESRSISASSPFSSFLPVSPEPPAFLFYSIDQHTQLSDFLPNLLRYKNCSRLTNLYNSLIQFTLLALNLYSVSYLCLLLHINPLQTHFILENGSNPMNS